MAKLTPPEEPIYVTSGDKRAFRLRPNSPELWSILQGNGWLAQVRKKKSDTTVAVTLSVHEEADAIVVTIPETTNTVWGSSTADTWRGYYDVQGMANGSDPVTIFRGEFIIERDVSRV